MRYYKKAESLRYLDPHFLNNYGVALLAQKRYREAHAKFIEAMTAFPDFEKSYLNALNAAPPREDAEGVRSILRRCLDKTFSDPALYKKAAEAGAALREYRPAIELYEKYLRHRPDDAAAMSQLADCYAALGCVDSAKLGYKAALEIDPDYSDAKENLAGLEN
jgi:Tfp pilus assembly protein PilF